MRLIGDSRIGPIRYADGEGVTAGKVGTEALVKVADTSFFLGNWARVVVGGALIDRYAEPFELGSATDSPSATPSLSTLIKRCGLQGRFSSCSLLCSQLQDLFQLQEGFRKGSVWMIQLPLGFQVKYEFGKNRRY